MTRAAELGRNVAVPGKGTEFGMACRQAGSRLIGTILVLGVSLASASAQRQGGEPLSEAARRSIQEALVWSGHYEGAVDAQFGSEVRRAIIAFQRDRGIRPTGILDEEGARLLIDEARQKREKAGFVLHDDAKTGIKLGLPLALAPPVGATERGSRFASPDGSFEIELFRFPRGDGGLRRLYRGARGDRARRITYARLRRDGFVVSGVEGARRFYTRAREDDGGVAAFAVAYNEAVAETVEPIIVAMSNSFADPGAAMTALDPPSPTAGAGVAETPLKPRPTEPIAAAFAVSSEGHFLTTARVAGCEALKIGDGRPATLAAVDRRNGLALLKTEGEAAAPLRFGDGAIATGDAVTAATPHLGDAQGYVSTGRVAGLAGEDGDTTLFQVALPPRVDDGGAPLIAADGSVIGVLAAMERGAVTAALGRPAPRSAVRRDMVRMFLTAHGLKPVLVEAAGGASADVADRARRATLPVLCDAGTAAAGPPAAIQR